MLPELDSPHRERSFEPLNVLFALFSRALIHTFTLGWNFGPLTISPDYLGYRHAIVKRIPGLDSPHRAHSLESLNVLFVPFSRPLIHTFALGRNLEPLTILQDYFVYGHAIDKWIPGLDSPR